MRSGATGRRPGAGAGAALTAACAAVAAARILLFSAAFPLFNSVDEPYHYDVVLKYSLGEAPRAFGPIGREAAAVIASAASWEFLNAPMDGRAPEAVTPLWRLPAARREAVLAAGTGKWSRVVNRQSREPPAYYAVAGRWLSLGGRLGQSGVRGAFWTRFMNALVFAGVLLLAAGMAAEWYPDRPLVRYGVPVLLALLPQDIFYAVNNDVPAAWWGAAAFWLSTEFVSRGGARTGVAVLAGACLGALSVTKLTSIPAAAAMLAFPLIGVVRPRSGVSRSRSAMLALLLVLAAAVPPAVWLLAGRGTGLLDAPGAKVRMVGISPKPLSAVPDHPLFTIGGAGVFARDLVLTFWRGEFLWHGTRAFPGWADPVFVVLTVAGLAGVLLLRPGGRQARERREIEAVALFAIALAVAALAWASVSLDFSRSYHPSLRYPYLSNGRHILALLVPCTVMVLAGVDRLAERLRSPRLGLAAVCVVAAAMVAGEADILRRIAGSAYNWFHLP